MRWVLAKTWLQITLPLDADEKWRIANPQDFKNLYGGLFRNASFGKHEEIFLNESSGWVEASKALQKVIEAAVFAGVKCVELDISSLVFDSEGACVGVQSKQGQVLSASHIVLATGAETAKSLMESATERPNLHPGNRLSTAGLITGVVKLD